MNPLAQQDYLIPVGNECTVPSFMEAFLVFAKENLYEKIKFGVAHNDEGDSLCWLLIPPKGKLRPLKAFNDNNLSPVTSFSELSIDSFFAWRGRYFQLVSDDCLQMIIKEMIVFPTEGDVYGYAQSQGYGDVEIYAVKVYKIGKTNEYLFPAWYIQMPEDAKVAASFFPMFTSDTFSSSQINTNELNWEFMEPGDTFLKDGELWRLYENEKEGLFINKAFKFKLIINKQRGG